MKQSLTLLILLLTLNSFSQFVPEPPSKERKQQCNFIIIWRSWDQVQEQDADVIRLVSRWRTNFAGFNTQKELIDWLNAPNNNKWIMSSDHPDKETRITESEFISAYDLIKMKKLEINFKTIEKSLPKRVEIQAEKWKETTAEIKDN